MDMTVTGVTPKQATLAFVGKMTEEERTLMESIIFEGIGLDIRRVMFSDMPFPTEEYRTVEVIIALGGEAIIAYRPEFAQENDIQIMTVKDTKWPDREFGPIYVVGSFHPRTAFSFGILSGTKEGNVILVSLVNSIQRAIMYMDGLPFEED